jgi:hypothetical protein
MPLHLSDTTERSKESKARSARNGYNGGQRELLREISKMLREQKEILGRV